MKKVIGLVLLVFCSQLTFAETAIIGEIVYELDLNKQTAMVLNFQTNTEDVCDVKIPPYVEYKHEIFEVTSLVCIKPKGYEFSYPYDKARINIEHLHLPNTLKEIYTDAFSGMARLKELVIPKSVELLVGMKQDGWLNSWSDCPVLGRDNTEEFSRIWRIAVLGIPTCKREERGEFYYYTLNSRYYYDRNNKKVEEFFDIANYDYKLILANTIAGTKSLDDPSTKLCPNLWLFSTPAIETELAPIKQCFSEMLSACEAYNSKLREQPYFDGSKLSYKLEYKGSLSQLKKDCDSIKSVFAKQYDLLVNGQMEENLRKKDLDSYIRIYQKLHPEWKPGIDSLRFEYRCLAPSKQNNIVLLFIDQAELPLSCRDSLYQQYQNLFSSKAEFDEVYNHESVDSLQNEIKFRSELRPWLDNFIDIVKTNPDAKLQGMKTAKGGSLPYRLNLYLRKFQPEQTSEKHQYLDFCYNEAINAILRYNDRTKAEYIKNKQYFANLKEFFEAYISPEYKTILKERKKEFK